MSTTPQSALPDAMTDSPDDVTGGRFGSAYLYYLVFIFFMTNLLSTMDRAILPVLVEPIRKEFGMTDSQVGSLSMAFAIFYAIFGLLLGRLTDTWSRSKLLGISIGLFSIGTMVTGYVHNFVQLFIMRTSVGVGEAGSLPASYSLIGDSFKPQHRASAMALIQSGLAIGSTLGLILAGVLAQSLGWRNTFIAFGVPGLLLALMILLTVKEPARGRFERPSAAVDLQPSFASTIKTLASNRTFSFIVFAYSVTSFGIYGLGYWIPALLIRSYQMSMRDIGLVYGSIAGSSIVVGMLIGAAVAAPLLKADRRWEMWMPGIVNILITFSYIIAFSVNSLTLTLTFIGISTFLLGFTVGPASASIQSTVPARMRGVAVAITMFISAFIGQGLGPWGIGIVSTALAPTLAEGSLKAVLQFVPVVFLSGGILYIIGAKTFHRDRVD
ncbi:MAG: MFS transporter [Sphingomonas sp.]|uniref:spinster family MFS transporter n=1 Tax=Sphingomonas sp. TaxID=28214 RepID=UPI0035A98251|nr:MFS transporter [Sphingomonas sp.]